MNNIYFDCEFTGLHQHTTLISIGLYDEVGGSFYAEFIDYDRTHVDQWIEDNVITNLQLKYNQDTYYNSVITDSSEDTMGDVAVVNCKGNKEFITKCLISWLKGVYNRCDRKLKFVSDCMAYDWVLINALWGGALNTPEFIDYIPIDICTMFTDRDIDPDINREEFAFEGTGVPDGAAKHNSLWDAEVIKLCYEKMKNTIKIGG
jgi:hypothetical protein